jgi:hypothetical protein
VDLFSRKYFASQGKRSELSNGKEVKKTFISDLRQAAKTRATEKRGVQKMKRATFILLMTGVCVFFAAPSASAQVNPNGFPSGEHFNLNIISKKPDHQCSLAEDEYGNPVYGNVIFVPEGENVQIKMQSGKIKGKKLSDLGDTLRVVDPCAGFPYDTTEDPAAILQLPPHNPGYSVYARMVGTPSGDMEILPNLEYVMDDEGNYLWWYAGEVDQGFSCKDQTIDPHQKGSKGKGNTGKSTAIDITCLFLWSGEVCYFDPDSSGQSYCGECTAWDGDLDTGTCIDYADCGQRDLCCQQCCDANTVDGVCCGAAGACVDGGLCIDDTPTYYKHCELPVLVDEVYTCGLLSDPVDVWCKVYGVDPEEPAWVFNIADFVQYFWGATNNGKVVQVRFYKN